MAPEGTTSIDEGSWNGWGIDKETLEKVRGVHAPVRQRVECYREKWRFWRYLVVLGRVCSSLHLPQTPKPYHTSDWRTAGQQCRRLPGISPGFWVYEAFGINAKQGGAIWIFWACFKGQKDTSKGRRRRRFFCVPGLKGKKIPQRGAAGGENFLGLFSRAKRQPKRA